MTLKPAPPSYDGHYSAFFVEFVKPNLPTVERVAELDRRLRRHLATADPVHVARMVRGQTRGDIVRTANGGQILPTDNSPVWWLHAFLLSDETFPDDDAAFFGNLPNHMFGLPKDRRYLNAAGYHAAHLVGAKNGDVNWQSWSRAELVRRTLVNIHPCNMFLVAKTDWTKWGGNADILRWVAGEYSNRYGAIMRSFFSDAGADPALNAAPPDPLYRYGGADTQRISKQTGVIAGQGDTHVKRLNRPQIGKWLNRLQIRKRLNRPQIRKRLNRPQIEKRLEGQGAMLDIHTLGRHFVVPHDELLAWVKASTSACETKSWQQGGVYNWPKPSRMMLTFLVSYEV